ncbi:MAG: hypothetical protein AAGJ82_08295 [Bacteroidota bacterium]
MPSTVSSTLIKDVFAEPSFGFVTAPDASGQPRMTRIYAYSSNADLSQLSLFVFGPDAEPVLANLEEGKPLAAVLSRASDFRTIQCKGAYRGSHAPAAEELTILRNHNGAQFKMVNEFFGWTQENWSSWNIEPALVINIAVQAVFEQTPQPNTGQKIQ